MFKNYLIIYGIGELATELLKKPEIKKRVIAAVVGEEYYSNQISIEGVPVKKDSYLLEIKKDYELVFGTMYFDQIYPKLVEKKLLSNEHLKGIYVYNRLGQPFPFDDNSKLKIEDDEWSWLEQELKDNDSLQLLEQIKKERQSPNFPSEAFVPIEQGFQHAGTVDYWESISGKRVHEDVIVIDAGAYKGDSISKLVKNVGGHVKIYYALEPAMENFQILKNNEFEEIDTFFTIKAAVGKECKTVSFHYDDNMPAASYCLLQSDASSENVDLITIDSLKLMEDADYFLKMDIEGNELDALIGASEFIEEKNQILQFVFIINREI